MKRPLRLFFALLVFNVCVANAQKYSIGDFYKIDSLAQVAKPKEALALSTVFYQQARTTGNAPMMIKAVIYRMLFQSYLEENAFNNILTNLKEDITLAKQPEKSILQSLLAETYWNYYQNNSYIIMGRTNVQAIIGDDINTWSIQKLNEEIIKNYLASLSQREILQQTKVDVLDEVLLGDKRTRIFRPTLYDLLAHRAIDVFTNTQVNITETNDDQVDLNNPIWLADRQTFLNATLPKSDSSSFYLEAIKIFRNLDQFHISNGNTAALADIDFKRLKFIYQRNPNQETEELYHNALNVLAAQSKGSIVYADILFEQATLLKNNQFGADTSKQHLVKAIALANKAIAAYPESIGAQNAKNLILQIKAKELTLKNKIQLLPNQPALLQLSYKNLDTVYLQLYKRSLQDDQFLGINNAIEFKKFMSNKKSLKSWSVTLPKSTDFLTHTLIDKLDGLPVGTYFIIAQNTNTNQANTLYAVTNFTVTTLSVNNRKLDDTLSHYFVTDYNNGNPLKGVNIQHITTRYKASPIKHPILKTDELGYAVSTQLTSNVNRTIVNKGIDSVEIEIDNYRYYREDKNDEKRIILFTDRPIYRPGQIIYYKGLFIENINYKNTILPGQTIELTFDDPNGQEIQTVKLTTNAYGTFQGSFTIPMGKLNGQMKLTTDYGSISVQVEEYKRPTFEVVFDPPKQRYQLNDSVKVKGSAMAFSGYVIANAKVKYTIFSAPIYDYSSYRPQNYSRKQIAIGQTLTGVDGKFELDFYAKAPDQQGSYNYEIRADITDLNGETRTKTTTIRVGKNDIVLAISPPPVLFIATKTDSIPFVVSNLNGERIKATVKAEWQILQTPDRLVNNSELQAENYTLSKEDFIKTFPTEAYKDELVVVKWPIRKNQFSENLSIEDGIGNLNYSTKNLVPGYYRVKLTATNERNDTTSTTNYILVYGDRSTEIKSNTEWIIAEKNSIAPNEAAIFRVAGLSKNSKGYYEVYYKHKVVEKVWLALSPQQSIVKVKPRADFEDGFAVQFSMVHHGTVYNSLQKVSIVDKEKQMELKFLTFRNKLQPGEKESWKLQISNKNGEKQMAEMVATLYDASLDDFKTMDWGENIHLSYDYDPFIWNFKSNEIYQGGYLWFLRSNAYYDIKYHNYESLNLYGYSYYGGYNFSYRNYLQNIKNKTKRGMSPEALKKLAELEKTNLVYGIVIDDAGYAVSGATVKVGRFTTTTNYFGVYSINAEAGDELKITYIGYKPYGTKVGKSRRLDILLTSEGTSMNEVVVAGYGVRSKRSVTGSISTISAAPDSDVRLERLEGRQSGLAADLIDKIPGIQMDTMEFNATAYKKTGATKLNNVVARSNFNESAFFYPQLLTNEKGEINIEFTIPQSLTRYKMMGFAHTKDLKTATISNELITQKQLAISINAPRFFREGDTILLSAKLNNLSGNTLRGNAVLELKNALTGKAIQILSVENASVQDFELINTGNGVLKWQLVIPSGINAITYKVLAQAGKYSDGEEMTLPVLPNAMLITESMPLNVRGNTSKTFKFDKLLLSGASTTLKNQALTFEFTANPIWYAIQALPYLMEYPHECAEQTFSKFYANSFAMGIINSSPKIKEIFKQWQQSNDGNALLSNLEKNQELKSILLEETPWVRQATSEGERKKRLATLFDLNRMSQELKSNLEQLVQIQNANGSFPWFTGMAENRYITQHIVLGMGQLQKMRLADEKAFPDFNKVLAKAVTYLDLELVKDYKSALLAKKTEHLSLHYLFARSYIVQKNENTAFKTAMYYYLKNIASNWMLLDTYQQAQAALILHRNGNKAEALKIINLLKQTAQQNDEMGMYWKNNVSGWWWYQNPIETQALLIEAFDEIAADHVAVEEMKIWLLKNKQTNDWKTTKATTAACYALLMRGYDLLSETNEPEIKIGNQSFEAMGIAAGPKEAGTGYQKTTIDGLKVKPEMGTVSIKNNNKTVAWGALYWQYFEQLDKITPSATGIKINKQLFLQKQSAKGNVLTPLTAINVLVPGDLVKVRIEIYADRAMEYLHLKDMRSAGFEPTNVISRYKYQDGLGYYESTKDASTNFFISYMPKGTYVFEYELRVTHTGNFSNGITSLQSMYAPEFSTHSEGVRVKVRE